jgi:two-component system nitrate/nitrite sensor histidine kinase NarX
MKHVTIDADHESSLESTERLSGKITGLLVLFFFVAVTAIGTTLYVSWQLEGSAAAINDAGSQRMRAYLMGYLMAGSDAGPNEVVFTELHLELEKFDKVWHDLEFGDPDRPLAAPRDWETLTEIRTLKANWTLQGRPLIEQYIGKQGDAGARDSARSYRQWVGGFVRQINNLVLRMEHNYAYSTNLLRAVQIALFALALLGTLVLIRFFFVQVIRPLDQIYSGIRHMADSDFGARLPVRTRDEFGAVAKGFNLMAAHLEQFYEDLEKLVASKTTSLEERNAQLALMYGVTAILNEASDVDALCAGFINQVATALGADAGSVRLASEAQGEMYMVAHTGLPIDFLRREMAINCGECICGHAAEKKIPIVADPASDCGMSPIQCAEMGFHTVGAFTINHDAFVIGVFSLFYKTERAFSPSETSMLETLGRHLGVAVEYQRLRSRDREHAIAEERNLLAQELHDSIAQALSFLNIQVKLLQGAMDLGRPQEAQKALDQIREGVRESYEDVRELLLHFRTRAGASNDLDAAIRNAVDRFELQTEIPVSFLSVGKRAPLEPDKQLQVLHIVQESLSNIRKHARASQVDIGVERGAEKTVITVRDNGAGFDPASVSASGGHVGLKIMKERASRVGAKCTVDSRPGQGTTVTLEL